MYIYICAYIYIRIHTYRAALLDFVPGLSQLLVLLHVGLRVPSGPAPIVAQHLHGDLITISPTTISDEKKKTCCFYCLTNRKNNIKKKPCQRGESQGLFLKFRAF